MATKIIRFDFTADANSVAYNSGTIGNGDYTTVDDNLDSIGMWDKVIYNGRRIVKKYNENQILRLPSHTVFEGGAWTVGFRFKHSDNISRNYLLYNYLDDIVNDMQYGFFIEVRSDIIQVTIGVGSAGNRLNIPFVCDEVSLYELAISYDPATKEATFTMNGIVLGTDTHTGVDEHMDSTLRPPLIGGFYNQVQPHLLRAYDITYLGYLSTMFVFDGIATLTEIVEEFSESESSSFPTSIVVAEPYMQPVSRSYISANIRALILPKILSSSLVKTTVNAYGNNDYDTAYRIEKGSPLTDKEIDRNFIKSNVDISYTPVFKNGFITNHIQGTIYFGGVTVNDVDGSYTGSGEVRALEEGYSLSNIGIAP